MISFDNDGAGGVRLPEILTMATVEDVLGALQAAEPAERSTVDASGVTSIDFAGMQLLIAMIEPTEADAGKRLSALSPQVQAVLDRAGITLPHVN